MNYFKSFILILFASVGSILTQWLGGWDSFLKALIMFMVVDYITGIAVAFIFHASAKTKNGGASSKECFKGIVKKICIIALVGVAVSVDNISGTHYLRSATIFFFLGNEGLSILENVGLMGVPYPEFIKKALEVIKNKGEEGNGSKTCNRNK